MSFRLNDQRYLSHKASPARNPLCLALDVDSADAAFKICDELTDLVGAVKLGPRLVYRYGAEFVAKIALKSPVFVDCKFFDIPSTMIAAVQASFDAGASFVTVHALSGEEALAKLAELELNLNRVRPFRILCVTILTSWDQNSLPAIIKPQSISDSVVELSGQVKKCGLSGLVCSAQELALIANQGFYCVTPGIRFSADDKQDQKRTMEPKEAIKLGSSLLVVGRPILQAKNRREAATDILAELI